MINNEILNTPNCGVEGTHTPNEQDPRYNQHGFRAKYSRKITHADFLSHWRIKSGKWLKHIVYVLESPGTGPIGKLMNQMAKIRIWESDFVSYLPFFEDFKYFQIISIYLYISSTNLSTNCITLLSHHWIHGLSRWPRWIQNRKFGKFATSMDFQKHPGIRCLKLPYIYYGEKSHGKKC